MNRLCALALLSKHEWSCPQPILPADIRHQDICEKLTPSELSLMILSRFDAVVASPSRSILHLPLIQKTSSSLEACKRACAMNTGPHIRPMITSPADLVVALHRLASSQ